MNLHKVLTIWGHSPQVVSILFKLKHPCFCKFEFLCEHMTSQHSMQIGNRGIYMLQTHVHLQCEITELINDST